MNTLSLPGAPGWFDGLLTLSIQAALLALIIWAIIKLLGRWLPPQWRALLWFVVIARVLIPFAPSSSFSLQNLFIKPIKAQPVGQSSLRRLEFEDTSNELNLLQVRGVNPPVVHALDVKNPKSARHEINPAKALAWLWAAGASLFSGLLIARSYIIRRRLIRSGSPPDRTALEALAECREALRVRYPIRVTLSDRIAAPALTGLFPARLILPTNFGAGQFTPAQQRQILLHEIAHLKEGHLLLHWLTLLARALQWFNPAIHFAAARLREECELAADAVALKNSTLEERASYGETILQVLARSCAPPTLLTMGMADRTRHLEQRLRALNGINRRGYQLAGIVVVLATMFTGLSGANLEQLSPKKSEEQPSVMPVIRLTTVKLDLPPEAAEHAFAVISNQAPNFSDNAIWKPKICRLSNDEMLAVFPPKGALGMERSSVKLGETYEFALGEEPAFDTNTPVAMEFPEHITIRPTAMTNQIVKFDASLVRTTFLGYDTNQSPSVPRFRMNEMRTNFTFDLARGAGNLGFYIPARSTNRITTDTTPGFGRRRVHYAPSMSTNACLVIITPTLAHNDISVPNSPMPIRTVPGIVVNPPFAPPTTTNGAAISYQQALSLFPDKTAAPHTNLPAPSGRLDLLRDEQIRSSPAIDDARRLIEIGRFDEAEALLKNALEEDSNNRAARDYLNLIKLRRGSGVTHAFSDNQTADRFVTNAPPSSLSRSTISRKLDSIRFDEFPLEQETGLIDVLKQLGYEIRKRDPGGRGVNFIISEAAGTNNPAALVDTERFRIKFKLPIRDVTLRQLLDAIVTVAKPLQPAPSEVELSYSVVDYGVVFSARSAERYLTRTFRVDPNTFRQGLEGVFFSSNPFKGISGSGGVAGPNQNPSSGGFFSFEPPPSKGIGFVATATNTSILQESARAFFRGAAGVDFATNNLTIGGAVPSGFGLAASGEPQPAMFFNDRAGVLFVRATKEELERIEQAIHALNANVVSAQGKKSP